MDSRPTSNHGSSQRLPSCYPSTLNHTSLPKKLRNLDDPDDFAQCRQQLQDENTGNYMVDFGSEEAWCAFDLGASDFSALLGEAKPFETRWINIWAPERQRDIVKALTTHYGISPRLRAMMGSDPSVTKKFTPTSPKLTSERQSMQLEKFRQDDKGTFADIGEVESGFHPNLGHGPSSSPVELDASGLGSITFPQIVNQIWHFVSVDFGKRYMCIGYNSLYAISDIDFKNGHGLPEGKRVWAWLVLCDDGTVISIQENPFPHPEHFSDKQRLKSLAIVRRNVNLIFSGISKQHSAARKANPLMTTQVRSFPNSPGAPSIKPGDGPSLLFYYIFDDWISSYSLVIKKEHSYSTALDKLREGMLERAQVDLIDDLHRLGRQLGVLKRIYQSYELILSRILKRQRRLREENRNGAQGMAAPRGRSQGNDNDNWKTVTYDDWDPTALDGIELSSAAFSRFERLIDRIGLYALSEIDECLTEKEALTFLVFNLIAMKDSQAVERLTRITILLAKVTILFLPVSLATSYFSTEVKELQNYTAATYWVTFAVVMFLSAVLLMLFGWLSGTVEGKPIYRSIVKTCYDASLSALGRRRRRGPQNHAE